MLEKLYRRRQADCGPALMSPDARSFLSAIDRELSYAFQPIVHLETGLTHGHEALVRGHERLGLKSIHDIFRLIDQHDIVAEAELVLMQKSVRTFMRIEGHEATRLFFNLNPYRLSTVASLVPEMGQILEAHKMDISRVSFELSEFADLPPEEETAEAINGFREGGLRIALDDFGQGYSRLKLLHEHAVDYVKFDRFFTNDVTRDPKRRLFLTSMIDMLKALGITMVAEGIETEDDLRTCRDLGFDMAQGYFIQRPTTETDALSRHYEVVVGARHRDRRRRTNNDRMLRDMVDVVPEIEITADMDSVFDRFRKSRAHSIFPVVDELSRPMGIIRDADLKRYVFSPFGKDLIANKTYGKRLVDLVREIPVADVKTPIDKVLQIYSADPSQNGVLIVDDAKYLGFLSATDLLKALNDQNVAVARDQNPLTKLPGNTSVFETVSDALDDVGSDWAMAYLDLDQFKPFNDTYGFRNGDRVILMFADILRQVMTGTDAFIGHIGGDDFFVSRKNQDFEGFVETIGEIRTRFAEDVVSFYDEEARRSGYIMAEGRDGVRRAFGMLTARAGVVGLEAGRTPGATNIDQVTSEFARLKDESKRLRGLATKQFPKDPASLFSEGPKPENIKN